MVPLRGHLKDRDQSIDQGALSAGPTMIPKGASVSGSCWSDGQIVLDGAFEGEVQCVRIIINEGAVLRGIIIAQEVIVDGQLLGNVWALELILKPNSELKGDVFQKALSIEAGAHFEGQSHHLEDPLGAAPSLVFRPSTSNPGSLQDLNEPHHHRLRQPQAAE